MSPRRRTRKKRRRRERRPAVPAAAPAVPSRAGAGLLRQVSWTGLAGALSGAIPFGITAVFVLIDPGEASRWWALPLALVAVAFLPAAWASVAPTPLRRQVQRGTTIACLVIAAAGVLTFGIGFAALLAVPTTLLAVAGGYIFQGLRGGR